MTRGLPAPHVCRWMLRQLPMIWPCRIHHWMTRSGASQPRRAPNWLRFASVVVVVVGHRVVVPFFFPCFFSRLFEPNPRGPCAEPESKAHGRLATRGCKSPQHTAGPCRLGLGMRPFTPAERGGWRQGRLARSALRQGDRSGLGWGHRRWPCHARGPTGARQQRHRLLRRRECRTTAVHRNWHNWLGGALVQTAPGYERGAERIQQPRNSSGLRFRWWVRLVGIAGHV